MIDRIFLSTLAGLVVLIGLLRFLAGAWCADRHWRNVRREEEERAEQATYELWTGDHPGNPHR